MCAYLLLKKITLRILANIIKKPQLHRNTTYLIVAIRKERRKKKLYYNCSMFALPRNIKKRRNEDEIKKNAAHTQYIIYRSIFFFNVYALIRIPAIV